VQQGNPLQCNPEIFKPRHYRNQRLDSTAPHLLPPSSSTECVPRGSVIPTEAVFQAEGGISRAVKPVYSLQDPQSAQRRRLCDDALHVPRSGSVRTLGRRPQSTSPPGSVIPTEAVFQAEGGISRAVKQPPQREPKILKLRHHRNRRFDSTASYFLKPPSSSTECVAPRVRHPDRSRFSGGGRDLACSKQKQSTQTPQPANSTPTPAIPSSNCFVPQSLA
jgi:hypothetical protein